MRSARWRCCSRISIPPAVSPRKRAEWSSPLFRWREFRISQSKKPSGRLRRSCSVNSIQTLSAVDVMSPVNAPVVLPEIDERAARRSMLDQIAKLERELAALFCATYPRTGFDWSVRSYAGPRLLGIAELERIRDQLADRLAENRSLLGDRTYVEARNRRLIEEMMLAPEKHKWMRIGNEDIGE